MEINSSIPIQPGMPPGKPATENGEAGGEAPGMLGKIGDHIKNIKDRVTLSVKKKVNQALDSAGEKIGKIADPALYEKKIEIPLEHKSYKGVTLEEAARMLGYFTQKMQNQGFPWALYEVTQKRMKKRAKISELEALRRLQAGKEVLLQPMRNMQFDISPDSLKAAAKIGGEQLKPVDQVATFTKDTKVSTNEGIEVRFGAPVVIKSFGELKLLFELYNPDAEIEKEKAKTEPSKIIIVGDYKPPEAPEKENSFGKTAHNLSYYTKKTLGTTYPWRFVKESDGTLLRMLKGMLGKGLPGTMIGAGVGIVIGGPIGLFTGAWTTAFTLATYGAMIGGGLMSFEGARDAYKGVDINAFETLSRVLDNKGVIFQERKKHSVNLPILGTFSWYNDYGKGSVVQNPGELELFTKLQDQE